MGRQRGPAGRIGLGNLALSAAKSARPGRTAAAARARDRPLGTFGGWEAWIEERSGAGPVCYALAHPAPTGGERQNKKTKLWVTHRP